jgi:hypothetical protein
VSAPEEALDDEEIEYEGGRDLTGKPPAKRVKAAVEAVTLAAAETETAAVDSANSGDNPAAGTDPEPEVS